MKRLILFIFALCLLVGGMGGQADAGGRETDTGRWPYNTIPVSLVDPDGHYVGISDQGDNGLLAVTVGYAHHENHECDQYGTIDNQTLASAAAIKMIINTPALPDNLHLLVLNRASAEANYQIYRAPAFSDIGTPMTIQSHNDTLICNSSSSSGVEIYLAPTITNSGTELPSWGDHFGAGQNRGGESRGTSERILRASTVYFINTVSEAANNDVTVELDFYVDDGDAP